MACILGVLSTQEITNAVALERRQTSKNFHSDVYLRVARTRIAKIVERLQFEQVSSVATHNRERSCIINVGGCAGTTVPLKRLVRRHKRNPTGRKDADVFLERGKCQKALQLAGGQLRAMRACKGPCYIRADEHATFGGLVHVVHNRGK